jgi:hypothetical protein
VKAKRQRERIIVEIDGRTAPLIDLAVERGIDYATLYWRWRRGVRGPALFAKPVKRRPTAPLLKRRERIAELVRAGWSNYRIRTEMTCGEGIILEVRRKLGIPSPRLPKTAAKPARATRARPRAPAPPSAPAQAEGYKHLTPQDLAALRGRARALRWGDVE